jgi:hypothetical protein
LLLALPRHGSRPRSLQRPQWPLSLRGRSCGCARETWGLTSEAAYQSVARLGVEHQNSNVRCFGEYSRLRNVHPGRAQIPMYFHIAYQGRVRPPYGFAMHKRTRLARRDEQDFGNYGLRPIGRRECRMSCQVLPNIGLGVCCCGSVRSFYAYAGLDCRCSRRIGIAWSMPRWSWCIHSVIIAWHLMQRRQGQTLGQRFASRTGRRPGVGTVHDLHALSSVGLYRMFRGGKDHARVIRPPV